MGDEYVEVKKDGSDAVLFRREDIKRNVLAEYFELYAGSLQVETDEDEAIWLGSDEEGVFDLSDFGGQDLKLRVSGRPASDGTAALDQNSVGPGAPVPVAIPFVQAAVPAVRPPPLQRPPGVMTESFKVIVWQSQMNDYSMKVEKGKIYTVVIKTANGVSKDTVSEQVSVLLKGDYVICMDDKGIGRAIPDTEATREQFWWNSNNTQRKFVALPSASVRMRARAYAELTAEQRQSAVDDFKPIAELLLELDLKEAKEAAFLACEELVTCALCMRPFHNSEPLLCKTCLSLVGCIECVTQSISYQQESDIVPKCPKCNGVIEMGDDGAVKQFTPVSTLNAAVHYYGEVEAAHPT